MVRNNFLLILALLAVQIASGETMWRYLVFLKDKPSSFDPVQFYSKKALDKRQQFNIPFGYDDIPCDEQYIRQLASLGAAYQGSSRWFNAVQVNISDPAVAEQVKALPFVSGILAVGDIDTRSKKAKFKAEKSVGETTEACDATDISGYDTLTYGQIHQMNGEYLHNMGYQGQGKIIAVLDAGFSNANNLGSLQHIYSSGRMLGTYDYVQRDSNVYESSSHGLNCFGLIGALKPDKYKGTATGAGFYLFKTENVNSELLSEEYFLAEALERCDQLGVDIATISLGYTTFDSTSQNHAYADLNGYTTIAAQAVNRASTKGILVLAAAGNEGNNSWKYISTPADADSCLAVAAVDGGTTPASFSSYGFPDDPRIKPNVACRGVNNPVINTSDNVVYGSGTSYATPLLAGMAACLWQAFPTKTNWEIKTAIEQSAHQYSTPDKRIGYGIPNFQVAYNMLSPTPVTYNTLADAINVFPNPFDGNLTIRVDRLPGTSRLAVINMIGQSLWETTLQPSGVAEEFQVDASVTATWPKGIYLVQLSNDKGITLKKIIKD